MTLVTRILAGAQTILGVALAVWLWRLGTRTRRSGQYPPPGMKLLRDMPIRTGAKARALADVTQLAAVVMGGIMLFLAWFLWNIVGMLTRA